MAEGPTLSAAAGGKAVGVEIGDDLDMLTKKLVRKKVSANGISNHAPVPPHGSRRPCVSLCDEMRAVFSGSPSVLECASSVSLVNRYVTCHLQPLTEKKKNWGARKEYFFRSTGGGVLPPLSRCCGCASRASKCRVSPPLLASHCF